MSRLGELGLSSYEVKVYRALLGLGPATAAEVSAASAVPQGRIYDVLNGLGGRGLLDVHESREPTRYVAVDPQQAVDVLLAERKEDLATQRERYEDIAAAVGDELAPVAPTRSQFWPATLGSDAAVSLIGREFEITDGRMDSVIGVPYADVDVAQYGREIEAIETHYEEGIAVRVLVDERLLERVPEAIQQSVLADLGNVEARAATDLALSVEVLDGEAVYVHVPEPFGANDRLGVIGVRDATFAERVEEAFERVWADATPV